MKPPASVGTGLADLATWAGEQQASGNVYGAILGAARARRESNRRARRAFVEEHERQQLEVRLLAMKDSEEAENKLRELL